MAKTYFAWYSTGEYGKVWFEADNEAHARELLDKVRNGELAFEDLPKMDSTIKGGDGFEFDDLQEID